MSDNAPSVYSGLRERLEARQEAAFNAFKEGRDDIDRGMSKAYAEAILMVEGAIAEQETKVTTALSLLQEPRVGTLVTLATGEVYKVDEGFDGTVVYDGSRYMPTSGILPVLRAAVKAGAAYVTAPEEDKEVCPVCKGRGGPVSSACEYDHCTRCGKRR